MAFYDKFPYTNFQELNLDRLMQKMIALELEQKEFINNNVIKYANPIGWDITTQYEANTVVTDVNGNAYISSCPVPMGVNITNTDYWSKIGNFDALWSAVKDGITVADEGAGTTATAPRAVGDLVWVQDKLLRVTAPMIAGASYVIGSNSVVTDIDDELKTLRTGIADEITERKNADTAIEEKIPLKTVSNVKKFGAKGDGRTDDTEAFINAISDAYRTGIVFIPPGTYKITSTLNITKSIRFLGAGSGENSSNTNGSATCLTTIKWAGGELPVIIVKSATSSEYLFRSEINGISIDGNSTATTGIDMESTVQAAIRNTQIRNVSGSGIKLGCGNNVLSQFNIIDNYDFIYGSGTNNTADGILIDGLTGALVTQTYINSCRMLVCNGSGISINNSDNNVINKLLAYANGSGYAAYLGNAANNNYFVYLAGGKVKNASNAKGNYIEHYISEGGGISIDSGGILRYKAFDYSNYNIFVPDTYKLNTKENIPLSEFHIVTGATNYIQNNFYNTIVLPKSETNPTISVIIPKLNSAHSGTVSTLHIIYTGSVNAAGNINLTVTYSHNPFMGWLGNNATTKTINFTSTVDSGIIEKEIVPIDALYQEAEIMQFVITRNTSGSSDTYSGDMRILGAYFEYVDSGPDSSGSGSYDVVTL